MTEAAESAAGSGLGRRLGAFVDLAAALGLALAALGLYTATAQGALNGDACGLVDRYWGRGTVPWPHLLYLPTARALASALSLAGGPATPLLALSALAGAVGVGATFTLARLLGAARPAAALATALFAVTPTVWFHATAVEVHGLHLALVAVGACVTVAAPWRRPLLALALVAPVLPVLHWSHQSALLLGPAWVLLVGLAARRAGRPLSRSALWLGVAPFLLACELAGLALGNLFRAGALSLDTSQHVAWMVEIGADLGQRNVLLHGFLLPFALLPLAALVGGLRRPRATELGLAVAAIAVLLGGFSVWWREPENGAYLISAAPLLAALAARALPRPTPLALAAGVALVALEGAAGAAFVARYDGVATPRARATLVRAALPDGGTLFTVHALAPRAGLYVEDVADRQIAPTLLEAHAAGVPPDALAGATLPMLRAALAIGPVAVDLSNPVVYDRVFDHARLAPYVAALADRLATDFELERRERAGWVVVRVVAERE